MAYRRSPLSREEIAGYAHSPVHSAVARRDHVVLRGILSRLPRLVRAGEIATEVESVAEELKAGVVSATLDRRDVPGRETPLHVAVRVGNAVAAEVLLSAGADWTLQNARGWNALQEAVQLREDAVAGAIVRHCQPLAWAKWCRRLPWLVAAAARTRDFYMELSFRFESSVVPFVARAAPSDTYRIWKRGASLRADMTLAGFDGLRVRRADQTVLFLGDGCRDAALPPGYLCILNHKTKEVMNALEGAGAEPLKADITKEIMEMSRTTMYRAGIDVTQAELVPQTSPWWKQERTEMVGPWKAKIYDMHHVSVTIKSRKPPPTPVSIPTAVDKNNLDNNSDDDNNSDNDDNIDIDELLTEDEKKQLEHVFKMEEDHHNAETTGKTEESMTLENVSPNHAKDKGWLGWTRKSFKHSITDTNTNTNTNTNMKKVLPPRSSLHVDGKISRDLLSEGDKIVGSGGERSHRRRSVDSKKYPEKGEHKNNTNGETNSSNSSSSSWNCRIPTLPLSSSSSSNSSDRNSESEYKKGLRPVLWLTPDFPLKTEELLPILDILADKVKAIRRLRELLATTLPNGMFPVKVAIPIVPTIRVVVTFTKFEDWKAPLEQQSEGFVAATQEGGGNSIDVDTSEKHSSSWFPWIRGPASRALGALTSTEGNPERPEDIVDPFAIPSNYVWTSLQAKKKRMKDKRLKTKREKAMGAIETREAN